MCLEVFGGPGMGGLDFMVVIVTWRELGKRCKDLSYLEAKGVGKKQNSSFHS